VCRVEVDHSVRIGSFGVNPDGIILLDPVPRPVSNDAIHKRPSAGNVTHEECLVDLVLLRQSKSSQRKLALDIGGTIQW